MGRHDRFKQLKKLSKTIGTYVLGLCLMLGLAGCSVDWTELLSEAGQEHEVWNTSFEAQNGNLRVIFLDVGQGASQLLISPSGKTMLIDGGNNNQEQVMLDYLEKYEIGRIDVMIGTHPDADHIGGLDRVIDQHDIGAIYMPKIQANTKTFESLLESIQRKGLKVKTAKAGVVPNWDEEVQVQMLAPVKTSDDSNNMSAVLKVTYGEVSFLLTGDAERESEKLMLESGADLQADVLLVGHHGSKSSTSASFLERVRPQVGVIQVGENSYGHPKEEILNRLGKAGVKVYRNDLHGSIEISTNGEQIEVLTGR
ncbi:ComEC/Rec2 family competence protein [Paenibacillus brevis]|uniref:MBL fold metallo-hydrolase n=1 Tax=Paenibacillus brevis TaxID=2841508 RepID=A0ABS6FWT7_9BACL|nr:ComEC/Rec2 family competence protein [Paenibacillus brevis]MBU5674707.1 MBL fold metallo-hydrolase [Paenibacillus brevis]